jgi:RNA polymerase sigma factor (sigma-70 family)
VAVSEMQIALLKAIRTYDPNRGMKRISWYYLNLLSASRSMYRNHTKNRISTKSNMKLDCPMDGDYVFGIDDRVCDLAMRDLDAKQHQIIHMRMYKGMSRPEVASALGITLQTVQTTEKRSLRIMRNALKERGINDIYDARHADGSNGEFICKE